MPGRAMKPALYFVRHGETEWNAERRFQGRVDVALNATGSGQAHRNGRLLAGLSSFDPERYDFIASPLMRARQTMEILRRELRLPETEYQTDARLVEVAYGDWQGLTDGRIEQDFPELHARRARDKWNFVPPGSEAESYAMQSQRVADWLAEVERPTLCVSHGGVMRCMLVISGNLEPQEAGNLEIPQDRVLRLANGVADWL